MPHIARLDAISAELGQRFRAASADDRLAVLQMCAKAAELASAIEPEIAIGLEALAMQTDLQPDARTRLREIAAAHDASYLDLLEAGDERGNAGAHSAAMHHFAAARLASALTFATSSESDALEEALYEAIHACGNQAEAVRALSAFLSGEDAIRPIGDTRDT